MAIATLVSSLKKKPDFLRSYNQRVEEHVAQLWKFIGPLTHATVNFSLDLRDIVAEAQGIGLHMYSTPFKYGFEFPEINYPFDNSTMISRDGFLTGDPEMLKKKYRVKLGITPIARMYDSTASPPTVRIVQLANVLLRDTPRQPTGGKAGQ